MQPWLQALLALAVVAVAAALVAALVAVRRAGLRAERVLAIAEQELPPLMAEVRALTDEVRAFTRQASGELGRVGTVVQRAQDVSDGLGRLLQALAGLTRAGQLIGVAAGVKTGLDVFVHRVFRQRGDHHG